MSCRTPSCTYPGIAKPICAAVRSRTHGVPLFATVRRPPKQGPRPPKNTISLGNFIGSRFFYRLSNNTDTFLWARMRVCVCVCVCVCVLLCKPKSIYMVGGAARHPPPGKQPPVVYYVYTHAAESAERETSPACPF